MSTSTSPTSRSPSPPSEPDVFAISQTLIPAPEHKFAGTSSLGFDGLLVPPLRLHEDLQEGCGGQLWPAGMTLTRYLLKQHSDLSNKHVIEMGAGGGLVGLAVSLGCRLTTMLVITDQQPMLSLMQKNIYLNDLDSRVIAQVYDWGTKPTPAFPTPTGHPDVVFAADCVYFEPAFPLLLQTLADLIGPTTKCYFCFKKRRKADMRFIRDMTKKFNVKEIDHDARETNRRQSIFLYEITMQNG